MGDTSRGGSTGGEGSDNHARSSCDSGPRNPDGTWVAGVVKGNYKPFPFPVGFTQGTLTIVRWAPHIKSNGRSSGWHPVVRCTCGWEGVVDRHNFQKKRTTRCNTCAKVATHTKRYWKYESVLADEGHRARLLNRISSCIGRCHNPHAKIYMHYGGRGIEVYAPWRTDRIAFLRYLLTLDGWDNPSRDLDRMDNNRGYEPGNLRFATRSENARNKRTVGPLQAEVADLRHRLQRAEEQIHNCDKCRATYSA